MWSAEAVFVCALGLLGRRVQSFPPVDLIEHVPAGVSATAQGYSRASDGRIALITSTVAFEDARRASAPCQHLQALREIAAVLVHEEWHLLNGPDEASAYDAQLTALGALGVRQDSPLYHKVFHAKLTVVAAARRSARAPLLARGGG